MNIYQIDREIEGCVDELGEVIDLERLMALQMERERKIENVACWIIDLEADAAAIAEQEKVLHERREKAAKKAEQLKGYLVDALAGEKYKSARVSIGYRRSIAVDVADVDALPENYLRVKQTIEPDKKAIKAALVDGIDVPGCTMVEKCSVIVR